MAEDLAAVLAKLSESGELKNAINMLENAASTTNTNSASTNDSDPSKLRI